MRCRFRVELKSGHASTYATPAGSPMAADDGALEISSDAFPVVMATVQESPENSNSPPSSTSAFQQLPSTTTRSRSLINTKRRTV